ncbi:MAG: hypothetical protein OI715_00250 (plasmid) [Candidatus Methanoperedens sp.]|nr:MAG: hypothetical protein OI715_00250 [Candidatus Methanoperedens sp.]
MVELELKRVIEDNIFLDKKIDELKSKIHIKFIDTNNNEIEKKRQDILIDVDKLTKLQEKIAWLFDDVSNKSKNHDALVKLNGVCSRIKNV